MGSEFTVAPARCAARRPAPTRCAAMQTASLAAARVLVVDDNRDAADSLGR